MRKEMAIEFDPSKPQCSLLLFLATPAEEKGLKEAVASRKFQFQKIGTTESGLSEEYYWLGHIGTETVIAVPPARVGKRLVMGAIGFLGTAARGMRFKMVTGAQGIVQLGMAFGIDRERQPPGDVLVSTSLIPYDNRDIQPAPDGREGYISDYRHVTRESARPALVELFRREIKRAQREFKVHLGALLSGAARIHSSFFRDELVRSVPATEEPILGGEMEGVGLLAAAHDVDDPIWCVVKGISDFADEKREEEIKPNRPIACRNAAHFVLSALLNDAHA